MFQHKQQKGLFTFYRLQAQQEQALMLEKQRQFKKVPKKLGLLNRNYKNNIQHQPPNISGRQFLSNEISSIQSSFFNYRNLQTSCILPCISESQEKLQRQEKRLKQSYKSFQLTRKYDIQDVQGKHEQNINGKESNYNSGRNRTSSITKTRKYKGAEIRKQPNSVILTRDGGYLSQRRHIIAMNSVMLARDSGYLSQRRHNVARIDEEQQCQKQYSIFGQSQQKTKVRSKYKSTRQMFPLLHIQNSSSLNYLIPKVRMKSKIIDKVLRLKNQKQIRRLRMSLQTQRINQKQCIQQSIVQIMNRNYVLPSINLKKRQQQQKVKNQRLQLILDGFNDKHLFSKKYQKYNDPQINLNILFEKKKRQLKKLLKRCKFHVAN